MGYVGIFLTFQDIIYSSQYATRGSETKSSKSHQASVHINENLKFSNQAEHIRSKLNMHKSISRRINNKLPLIPAKIYYIFIYALCLVV